MKDARFLSYWICPWKWCDLLDTIDECYTPCYCCWYEYETFMHEGNTNDKDFNDWILVNGHYVVRKYRFHHTLGHGTWKLRGPAYQKRPNYDELRRIYDHK